VREVVTTSHLVGVLATAMVFAAVSVPLLRRIALRLDMVDQPAPRKEHDAPVPLLGGVALCGAVLVSLLALPDRRELAQLGSMLGGATWISAWGLRDDRRPLHPGVKLLSQVVAAVVLMASGVQVRLDLPTWLNLGLALVWILGITNALNLLDNMDGLAAGVGGVVAASFTLLAAANGQYLVGAMSAAVLGACLGFLIHNFHPASIFMGDSGSLFLGFLLAALGIKLRFSDNVATVTWMVPVLVLGVAVFDTTLVVVSRLRRGLNPFMTPGRDHLSHRLVSLGWSRREAVLLHYLLGGGLAWIAVLVSMATPTEAYAIGGAVALIALAFLVWLERRWAGGFRADAGVGPV
jgi:UDP-GlcNAc:undecaprenyl-phosphate GlcNAc-1-phosphate transferase